MLELRLKEFIPSLFDLYSAYRVNLAPQVVNKEIYLAKEILDSVKNKTIAF